MKKLMIVVLLLAGFILPALAQNYDKLFDNDKLRKQLSLTDKEVKDLKQLWDDTQKQIQVANADRDVKASELKRLLLETPVNMTAVQKTLRDAMDFEYNVRLAEVQRAVKAKEILGDKRWADGQRYMRGLMGRMRGANRDNDGNRGPRNNMMPPPRNNPPPRDTGR